MLNKKGKNILIERLIINSGEDFGFRGTVSKTVYVFRVCGGHGNGPLRSPAARTSGSPAAAL